MALVVGLLCIGLVVAAFAVAKAIPSEHAGGGALAYTYYANDQVRTISQDGVSKTYALDPLGRQRQSIATGGTTHVETLHYQDGSDSPSWIRTASSQGQETSWQRNIRGIEGDLVAAHVNIGQGDITVLGIQNLHGDIVANIDINSAGPLNKFETDEFGMAP